VNYLSTLVVATILSTSASGGVKCLKRQDPDGERRIKLVDFTQPREDRILITAAQQLDCSDAKCAITIGDTLVLDQTSKKLTWNRIGLSPIQLSLSTIQTGASVSYLKSNEVDGYVYYLMQHLSSKRCYESGFKDADRNINEICRTYEFEAFRTSGEKYTTPDSKETYTSPDGDVKNKVEWADDCTMLMQPGSGGGSEPPPPPKK
jgi:hypothetical protein